PPTVPSIVSRAITALRMNEFLVMGTPIWMANVRSARAALGPPAVRSARGSMIPRLARQCHRSVLGAGAPLRLTLASDGRPAAPPSGLARQRSGRARGNERVDEAGHCALVN